MHIAAKKWNRADKVLTRALAIANRIAPDGDIVPEVLRRRAEVALGRQQLDDALKMANDAADRAMKAGDRYEHATALRVTGQALRAHGREREAVQTLQSALATLEELGEVFERDRIVALLEGRHGKKPGRVRYDSPQSRELRRLLAEHGMIGSSRRLQDMMRQITLVAPIQMPVLIQGETGTGKELVAQAIHAISSRAAAPLVAFNCATCPPDLLDAELFGHARGAFTGAHQARVGLVRSAQGGTLFLDEIGELHEESQARLLRLLDSGEIRPLGSDQSIRANVRIIAATHVDLKDRIERRRFRPDLYFRLAGIRLFVPALRDRQGDVRELISYFAQEARVEIRPGFAGFAESALRRMESCSWPGNVRQLRMEVLRLAAMTPDGVLVEEWEPPDDLTIDSERLDSGEAMRILEDRDRLEAFVRDCEGQMKNAAYRLGVSRGHLYRILKKTGIRVKDIHH